MAKRRRVYWDYLWDYAIHFGWTPTQVGQLTLDEDQYYRGGFKQMRDDARKAAR